MRVVVDTNVYVSGLLGLFSYPARIIDLVYNGHVQCVYDDRIYNEYAEVLSRVKFSHVISVSERTDLLAYLKGSGFCVLAPPLHPFTASLPDPSDLPFAEVAVAGAAQCLITGNTAHFQFFVNNPWGVDVVSPRDFVERFCQRVKES